MFTGKKFDCNIGAYYRFGGLSDELCKEYGLTVIEKPRGKTPRNIYFAEKRGEPTKYNLMRKALDEAMAMCITYKQFKKVMYKKGYIINDDPNRKYPTIRSINDKRAVRLYQLGEKYLLENIEQQIYQNPYYVQDRYYKLMNPKSNHKKTKIKYKGKFDNMKKMSGLEVLFLLLFYLLGLYPKQQEYNKPLSPEMKRAVRKMHRYSNQIRLIVPEKLNTTADVKNYILRTQKEIEEITAIRQKYRNKLRNCKDSDLINEYKAKCSNCTAILKKYRRNIKIVNQILEDVPQIKEVIRIEKQMRTEELNQTKTKTKNKYKEVK